MAFSIRSSCSTRPSDCSRCRQLLRQCHLAAPHGAQRSAQRAKPITSTTHNKTRSDAGLVRYQCGLIVPGTFPSSLAPFLPSEAWICVSSSRASPIRTPTSSRSTAGCATNASTNTGSQACCRRGRSSKPDQRGKAEEGTQRADARRLCKATRRSSVTVNPESKLPLLNAGERRLEWPG